MPVQELYSGRVKLLLGDITREEVDAIVNAANSSLLGGGGVDGAIHATGGPEILKACQALRASSLPDGLKTGRAVATTAGRLKARHVIHTVGPIWRGGGEDEDRLLREAYQNSLKLAKDLGLDSIAFPAISTGVYGFPGKRAGGLIRDLFDEYFTEAKDPLKEVRLVFFSQADLDEFLAGFDHPDSD